MKASSIAKAFPFTFLALPLLPAQNVVFSDDMTDTFYSAFSFSGSDSGFNPDDVSSAFWEEDSTGGNPGDVFNLFHEHDIDRDEFGDPFGPITDTEIQSFFVNGDFEYTPSIQGTIQQITFSLDVKTSDPITDAFFVIGDFAGSNVARGFSGMGFLNIVPDGEWQTLTLSGVMADEVGLRDFAGAAPLDFGFGFISSAEVFNGPETFFAQADNFRVEITPIPEPSSTFLLSMAACGIFFRRR